MSKKIVESLESYGLDIGSQAKNKPLFTKIGIVGAGKEGRNIINLCATAGMEVVFMEESKERITYVLQKLEDNLDIKMNNWGLTQSEKKVIMNRITPTLDIKTMSGCDLVVESTRYSETGRRSTMVRKDIFKKLENILDKDAIIATNGPTVIISELAAELIYKDRCVSLYFPFSHPDAKIIEIVRSIFTSDEVLKKMDVFAKLVGLGAHHINESNGNVSMRLMTVMLNESCQMLLEGICSMECIEETYTIIYGHRYGIFHLADIIGIERIVSLMEAMFNDFGDKRYKPNPILWRLCRSNQLGVRSGKGFYIYNDEGHRISENKTLFN